MGRPIGVSRILSRYWLFLLDVRVSRLASAASRVRRHLNGDGHANEVIGAQPVERFGK